MPRGRGFPRRRRPWRVRRCRSVSRLRRVTLAAGLTAGWFKWRRSRRPREARRDVGRGSLPSSVAGEPAGAQIKLVALVSRIWRSCVDPLKKILNRRTPARLATRRVRSPPHRYAASRRCPGRPGTPVCDGRSRAPSAACGEAAVWLVDCQSPWCPSASPTSLGSQARSAGARRSRRSYRPARQGD